MLKFFFKLSFLLTLSSCNSIPSNNVVSGTVPNDTIPLRGFSKVSIHPDKLLKINTYCDLTMRIEIVQSKNYAETIMELKNRALLIGGNAISLSKMTESTTATYLIGKIYLCSIKPYHLHPHPLGI